MSTHTSSLLHLWEPPCILQDLPAKTFYQSFLCVLGDTWRGSGAWQRSLRDDRETMWPAAPKHSLCSPKVNAYLLTLKNEPFKNGGFIWKLQWNKDSLETGDTGRIQKRSPELPVTELTTVILMQILLLHNFFSLSVCHKIRDNNKFGLSVSDYFTAFSRDFPLQNNSSIMC